MKRSSFLKSLLGLAAAPKILGEISIQETIKEITTFEGSAVSLGSKSLISDLQLLTPHYYKQYVERYGNEDYTLWLSNFANESIVTNE